MARREAGFVLRQHGADVVGQLQGKRRSRGQDARGRALFEQALSLTEPATGAILLALWAQRIAATRYWACPHCCEVIEETALAA